MTARLERRDDLLDGLAVVNLDQHFIEQSSLVEVLEQRADGLVYRERELRVRRNRGVLT